MGLDPVVLLPQGVNLAPEVDLEIARFPASALPQSLWRLRDFLEEVRVEKAELQGGCQERWRHIPIGQSKGRAPVRSLVRRMARYRTLERALSVIEWKLTKRWACSQAKAYLDKVRLDLLVAAGYSSTRVQALLTGAAAQGTRVAILTNSWKDTYVRPRAPRFASLIGVWTEQIRRDVLKLNPEVKPDAIQVTGSLHLAALAQTQTHLSRAEFCEKFQLDPGRPIVCYSAASPKAVAEEEQIVASFIAAMGRRPEARHSQVLIRGNPMGGHERFLWLTQPNRVAFQEPLWVWDAAADWCAPRLEDLALWRATIEHCDANVSVASTVTLEFGLFGKPVINVLFGAGGDLDPQRGPLRYWEAPFYGFVRERSLALPAATPEEAVALLVETRDMGKRATVQQLVPDLSEIAARLVALIDRD